MVTSLKTKVKKLIDKTPKSRDELKNKSKLIPKKNSLNKVPKSTNKKVISKEKTIEQHKKELIKNYIEAIFISLMHKEYV